MFEEILVKIKNNKTIPLVMAGILLFFMVIALLPACSATTTPSVPAPKTVDTPASAPVPATTQTPLPISYPKPPGPIKEKWINATVDGDTLLVLATDIRSNWNTAFKMTDKGKTLNFMAYVFNGEIQVRANVCPPCRSIGYSLNKDELVCDTCETTFKAVDGLGIQGACVKFPKAAIKYQIVNDNLVMNIGELVDAYQRTLNGKG